MEPLLAGLGWLVTGGVGLKLLELGVKLLPHPNDAAAQFRDALQRELEGQRQAVSRALAERDRAAAERDRWHEEYFALLDSLHGAGSKEDAAPEQAARRHGKER